MFILEIFFLAVWNKTVWKQKPQNWPVREKMFSPVMSHERKSLTEMKIQSLSGHQHADGKSGEVA